MAKDRAALFATAVVGLFVEVLQAFAKSEPVSLGDTKGYIEALVREEFADIERQAAAERIAGID